MNTSSAYNKDTGDLALFAPVNKSNQPLGPSDTPPGVDPGEKFPFYNVLTYHDAERKLTHRRGSLWKTQHPLRRIHLQTTNRARYPYCQRN